MSRALGRIILAVIVIVVLAGGGFVVWAHQPAIAPVAPQQKAAFDQRDIVRGAELVAIGNCTGCHAGPKGSAFAGGYPVPTPFGTIYGSNISPDPDTGIGRWSEAAFRRAMHQGVRRDGAYLYPAFPYTHFTKTRDSDIKAIYAYLMTRPAMKNRVKAPDLPFPLDVRLVMAGWNLMFFHEGRFKPVDGKSAQWNAGAYLAEGLGHCGACHTPMNALGAERADAAYAGGAAEGWDAPALDAASPSPTGWTQQALATYLTGGFAKDHGVAAGPMTGVAAELRNASVDDVGSLSTYVASLGNAKPADQAKKATAAAQKAAFRITSAQDLKLSGAANGGEAIFASACASCHFSGGEQPFSRPLALGLSSAVNAPTPRNFVNIVMNGVHPPAGARSPVMPSFRAILDHDQTTQLAAYVRSHFTDAPAWKDIGTTVTQARKETGR